LASVVGSRTEPPLAARFSLAVAAAAGMCGLFAFVFAIRRASNQSLPELRIPPSWMPWLTGFAAIGVGLLIETTIFT